MFDNKILKALWMVCALLSGAMAAGASAPQTDLDREVAFNIAPQPLESALLRFSQQAGVQLLTSSDEIPSTASAGVSGRHAIRAALTALLQGTGLTYSVVRDGTITIGSGKSATTSEQTNASAALRLARVDQDAPPNEAREASKDSEAEIVVIGTNIRGVYPKSSPVEIYTAEDIRRSGAATLEQFIGKLPQNLGTTSQYGSGSNTRDTGAENLDSVTGVDLRGLGAGTTLTLLNGRRMGLSDYGRTADISLIPAAAIERVEVLTDGASAIYGSDAVGGVVNFVLKKDFDGAETRVSYGAVGSGNLSQIDASQTVGNHWQSGHALLSYRYFDAQPLRTTDRSFSTVMGPGTLTAADRRHNVLLTASQDIAERWVVGADVAFTSRDTATHNSSLFNGAPAYHTRETYGSESRQSFVNLGVDYKLSRALNASLRASYSANDTEGDRTILYFNQAPQLFSAYPYGSKHSALDTTAMVDGVLAALAAGEARFSLGAGRLTENYEGERTLSGFLSDDREMGRRTDYLFAEAFAPLIGPQQGIPGVRHLDVTLAARYTRYKDVSRPALDRDFGDAVDPKVGVRWAPFESLDLRATYGTSFRAPSLTQIDPSQAASYIMNDVIAGQPATMFGLILYPAGDLEPETARNLTVGFDWRPQGVPNLQLGATFYRIDYRDRIGTAVSGSIDVFARPDLVPDLFYRSPSAAFLESQLRATTLLLDPLGLDLSNPAAAAATLQASPNLWIYDVRFRNLALSEQDGLDLYVRHRLDTAWGAFNISANVTRILSYDQQTSPNSSVMSVYNYFNAPVDLRGRAALGFTRGGFDANLGINYADGYANPYPRDINYQSMAPIPVASWTTFDWSMGYDFAGRGLDGLRLTFSVQNLFDKDPPYVDVGYYVQPVGFDTTNANPIGRFLNLGVSYQW